MDVFIWCFTYFEGMIALYGGKETFIKNLTSNFKGKYYQNANEP